MKKISFGSFPLSSIRKDDRKCLDRYLIKTFSDNISVSDAMRNLSKVKNLMYITPDTLMKQWLDKGSKNNNTHVSDRTNGGTYDASLKRAFYILKEFYKKIQHAPFYKDYVYYPIYVERVDTINVRGNSSKSNTGNDAGSKNKRKFNNADVDQSTVQMDYSFVILSNDLTKSLKIDEIKYDDNASLNFLFLFIEFFSSNDFSKSIHDFNDKDYQFIVKMYQFIEESGKDPIHMVLDLYKLLALIKDANSNGGRKMVMGNTTNNLMNDIDAGNLRKYKGLIRHNIYDIISKQKNGSVNPKTYQESFQDIMNIIFKSEGLSGLYNGVDSSADLGERYRYVYSSNKYREILNVAKELVDYNKLDESKIISSDTLDFDFRVERGNYTMDIKRDIISQKYQTFFKTYVESISSYLENTIQLIVESLKIPDIIQSAALDSTVASTARQAEISSRRRAIADELSNLDNDILHEESLISAKRAQNRDYRANDLKLRGLEAHKRTLETEDYNLDKEYEDIDTIQNLNRDMALKIEQNIKTATDGLYRDIKDRILTGISTDLAFIFDDGKRFFTNPMIAEGFMSTVDNPRISPLTSEGFDTMAAQAHDTSLFPEKIQTSKGEEPNPEMYTAQIVKSLKDSFDVMAGDAVTLIADQIMPAIEKRIGNSISELNDLRSKNNTKPEQIQNNNLQYVVLDLMMQKFQDQDVERDFKDTLANDVFKDRFINNVLVNFRKLFRVRQVDSIVQFNENVSQLHPLIQKLLKSGEKGQYFKSFIINFDTVEQIYNTKFVLDTQKFLTGLINTPPRKLSNVTNRINTVLYDYLGLKKNPVWLLSKTDVYLSMPDDLSLTNTSIISKIPKTELMDVCKIKASDFWNEGTMGKVAQFKNNKADASRKSYEKALNNVEKLNKELSFEKDLKKADAIKRKLDKANKLLDIEEEKYNKAKMDDKNYTPNAFVFAEEDPNKAENTELLSDSEREDLKRAKDNLETSLGTLQPYDQEEVDAMKANIENQVQRGHPFDYEDREPTIDPETQARQRDARDDADYEEWKKQRDEAHERKNS